MASDDYRVGILSDIHGNLIPLRFAHNHLRQLGVDTVICAGDVASFGSDPNDAISFLGGQRNPDRLWERRRGPVVRPNNTV